MAGSGMYQSAAANNQLAKAYGENQWQYESAMWQLSSIIIMWRNDNNNQ